jgi:PAS domain S-box-containing protein
MTWKPWGALVLGLLATTFLVVAVAAATSRARIRRLVERRSREIQAAYDTLAHEAQQRLWAMMETRQTQRRLREIVDLVPDMIYVKDRYGRYLLANQATAKALGKTVEQLTVPADSDALPHTPELDKLNRSERALVDEQRSLVTPPTPFVDAQGRRRLLRTHKIPFTFEDDTRALLCVATDVTRQEQATETQRSQNRVLADLARGIDPELVLAKLVREAEALVPDMRCSILLVAPDGRHLRHGFGPSLPGDYNAAIDGIEIGPDVGSCGAAAHLGKRVIVEDVMTHPNWEAVRDLARRANIRASWSEPIRSSDGEVLGTFAMYYSNVRSPDEHELRVMESWAHLAGIAIERRRTTAES